jgi:hypothetical protein
MLCDVCGHEMRQLPTGPGQGQDEDWLCSWCYAMTTFGSAPGQVLRPDHLPVHLRWEQAESDELASDVSHAYGFFETTLCGIRRSGMAPSPHLWGSRRPNACESCKEAAAVIDQRWPLEKRDGYRMRNASGSESNGLPF